MLDGYKDDGWPRVAQYHQHSRIAFIGVDKLAFNLHAICIHPMIYWKFARRPRRRYDRKHKRDHHHHYHTSAEHYLSRTKVEIYDGINFHRVEIKAFNGYVSFLFAPLLPIVVGCSVGCCITRSFSLSLWCLLFNILIQTDKFVAEFSFLGGNFTIHKIRINKITIYGCWTTYRAT
jgi:hypothetical protein